MTTPSTPKTSKYTSAQWLDYFLYNRENLLPLPWNCPYQITEKERRSISHSIRNFQLGESSEGSNLIKAARDYAADSGDATYIDTVKLFIAEEQRHARDLGRFMQQQEIAIAKRHWSDTLFRKLRKLVNLEVAIVVLITAELIAKVYYKALQSATQSPLLQQICTQILLDESKHVEFQAITLKRIRAYRPKWQTLGIELLQKLFFLCTILVVWLDHNKVFLQSGYTFQRFAVLAWLELRSAIQG